MTLQDLANLGEAIGGIAVLITLIFLTFQIRSTRIQLSRQNGRELLRQLSEIALTLSKNSRLMEVHVNAQSDFQALSEADSLAWVNSRCRSTTRVLSQGGRIYKNHARWRDCYYVGICAG